MTNFLDFFRFGRWMPALALCAGMLSPTQAADFTVGSLALNDLWVRASVPGQTNGAGYLQINNPTSATDRLLSAQSEAATRVELHTVLTEDALACLQNRQQ